MAEHNTSHDKQCGGKIPHLTKKQAKAHVRGLKRKRNSFRAYLCPHCNFWHVGRDVRVIAAASRARHYQ